MNRHNVCIVFGERLSGGGYWRAGGRETRVAGNAESADQSGQALRGCRPDPHTTRRHYRQTGASSGGVYMYVVGSRLRSAQYWYSMCRTNEHATYTITSLLFQFIRTVRGSAMSLGSTVSVECPARIDIAGGWSDTPPITYEHGGSVLNAAILLDGKRPIGVKVTRIDALKLVLQTGIDDKNVLTIDSLWQLGDYCSPQAPGALLKAAFICADIVQYPSQVDSNGTSVYFMIIGTKFSVYSNVIKKQD